MRLSLSIPKQLFILFLSNLLLACGGGGGSDSSSDLETGVFLDSAVSGLHYETPTQSGLTNSSGEFKYKQGESVTFSVGGITLGSTLGANQITPFDLFNLTAPQTEAEVLSILNNFVNVDDFDRALNMVVFLTSLDNDGNPDNGLDLTGWHTALSDASLSFDYNKNYFSYNEFNTFAKRFGVTQSKSLASAFTHIINSLNINITVNLISQEEIDNGNDGSVDQLKTYNYDSQGRQIAYKSDSDNDGNFEQISNTVFNSEGLTSQNEGIFDFDGSAGQDFTNTNITDKTYDSHGNILTSIQNSDTNGDSVSNERITTTYTYDENDNLIYRNKISSLLNPVLGEVLQSIETETATYDTSGNQLTLQLDYDSNADTITDSIQSYGSAFNAEGLKVSKFSSYDSNADGTLEKHTTTSYSYDSNGNKTTELRESDYTTNHDGVDEIRSTIFTYDAQNNVLTKTSEDSVHYIDIATPHEKQIVTFSYNTQNRIVSNFIEHDSDNDGSIDATYLTEYEYDTQGNSTKTTNTQDDDLQLAGYDAKDVTTNIYDNNNLITSLYESDNNGDTINDYIYRLSNTFDNNGLKQSALTETDNNADGTFETSSKTTFSYTPISGGLLGLVLQNILL